MKTTGIIEVEKLPNGTYDGIWGAHTVNFEIGGVTYKVTTEIGVKCPMCPCKVIIKNNVVTIETD